MFSCSTGTHVSCSTRRRVFLSNKKTCLLVQQADMFSSATRRHVLSLNKRTFSSTTRRHVVFFNNMTSSSAARHVFFFNKKTCFFFNKKTCVLLQREHMFSFSIRNLFGVSCWGHVSVLAVVLLAVLLPKHTHTPTAMLMYN